MTAAARRIFKVSGIVVGAAMLTFALFALKFTYETRMMTPVPTGPAADNVYSVQDGFANVFLVRAEGAFIAIDAGNDADNIRKEMKKLAIDPALVSAVFLTHTDNDHVAGLKIFTNAKVYISKPEEQMINGTRRRMLLFSNNKLMNFETLEDGQVVAAGGVSVRGILTPGHTPGSMCYLVNGRYLFTGDTLSLKNGTVGQFNEFFNMDTATEMTSIGKLSELRGVTHVFTAHYGAGDFAKVFEKWRR